MFKKITTPNVLFFLIAFLFGSATTLIVVLKYNVLSIEVVNATTSIVSCVENDSIVQFDFRCSEKKVAISDLLQVFAVKTCPTDGTDETLDVEPVSDVPFYDKEFN